jgi:phosphoglycerol transferase MdoB-like AlkP superfamily enzyme
VPFLQNQTCLSDVLAGLGYNNAVVVGSPITFAGQVHFAASHNIPRIIDQTVMEANSPIDVFSRARPGYAVDDQMVFAFGRDLYDEFTAKEQPLFISLQTGGPHGASGYLSRNCKPNDVAVMSGNVAATTACKLQSKFSFIEHVRETRGDRSIVIMVTSDHLKHAPEFFRNYPLEDRRNFVTFMSLGFDNPVANAGDTVSAQAPMIDIYPSLLAYLGIGPTDGRAALGISIFGETPTLVAQKGFRGLNEALLFAQALVTKIWE